MDRGRAVWQGVRANSGSSGGASRRRNWLVRSSPGDASVIATPSVVRQFSVVKSPTTAATTGRLLLRREAPRYASTAVDEQHHHGVVAQAEKSFRFAMMKERRPFLLLSIDTVTTVGSICGHASLGILALCYLETDALSLRELVIAGSSLNIFFSYYRTPPLWISIKWNAFFLAINAALIGIMWKEREDAEEFVKDPEQARIYRDIFLPVELNPVEFMQLMALAQRRAVLKGNDITQQGRPHEEMFLIVEGTADVKSEGEDVCYLEPGGFVGSMAFNRFIQEKPVSYHSANGSVAAPREGNDAQYGGKGLLKAAKDVIFSMLRGDSVVGNVAMSLVPDVVDGPKDLDKMERTKNTVTATSDVVVYVWDQHALRAFINRRHLVGAGLQKAISEDFSNKVDLSRGHKTKYRMLLEEALAGGEINLTEKKKLHRYRKMHDITLKDHKDLLKGRGWTEEEFKAGFRQGVAPRQGSKHFIKYEGLVQRELAKGKVTPQSKLFLRNFRKHAGIDAQEHILALGKQGWTLDDYEVGVKEKTAVLDRDLNSAFSSSEDVSDNNKAHNENSTDKDKADTKLLESKAEEAVSQHGKTKQEGQTEIGLYRQLPVGTHAVKGLQGPEMVENVGG